MSVAPKDALAPDDGASLASRLGWPALAALAPIVVAAPFATGGASLAWRDAARILAAIRPLVVEALRAGRLPLWNPHVGTGTPLLGDAIHGVLHPISLVAALFGTGIDGLFLLYLGAAGLGAFAAARSFGTSRAAAAIAGIGYGASGVVLGSCSFGTFLAGAATIPWVLASARMAGLGGRFGIPLLAAALAATVLSGDLQAAAVAGALALVIAAEGGGARGLLRAGIGAGVAMLLSGVQLWPTWEVMQRSFRVSDLDPTTLHQWALHPWRLVELVAPGFVSGRPGATLVPAFVALEPESRFSMPFYPSAVIGAPVVIAACAGLRTRSEKLLAAVTAVLIWMALGHRLGAQQATSWIPVWRAFRYAEKLLPHVALLLAVLAARGADAVAADRRARRAAALGALALAVVVGAAGTAYAVTAVHGANPSPFAREIFDDATRGLMAFAVALAVSAVWLALAARRATLAVPVLAAVALGHAAAAAPFALLSVPADSSVPPPRLDAPAPGPRVATPPLFAVARPEEPGAVARFAALETEAGAASYNVASRLDNVDLVGPMTSRRFELLWDALGEDRWVAFRRFGVTHVAVPVAMPAPMGALAARVTAGGARAVEGRQIAFYAVPHRSWAFFADAVRAVPGQRDTLDAVRAAVARGSNEVILEARVAPPVAAGRVLRIDRGTERVVIEAEAEGDGVLVVNDAYWPGWTATIDGAPAELLAADVLVRAVPFPAGRHRLEMSYAPPEVRRGEAATALGAALALALALADRRRSRRAPPELPV